MISIELTLERYGYDPADLKPKSNKRIVFFCTSCNKEGSTLKKYYRENHICKRCRDIQVISAAEEKRKANALLPGGALSNYWEYEQIDPEETQKRFGYHIAQLARTSAKRIVYRCASCEGLKDTQYKTFNPGHTCMSCANGKRATDRAAIYKEMGLCPNGKKLGMDLDEHRRRRRDRMREWRKTLIGQVTTRMRNALRRCFKQGSFSKYLDYTPEQLRAHIHSKLQERNYTCPICNKASLHNGKFEIDHRTAVSSLNDKNLAPKELEIEMKKLFALSNLDVLCKACNIRKLNYEVHY